MEFNTIGKLLLIVGGVMTLLGVAFMFFDKIPFLGKLPGDITIKRENFNFYFPITTSLLVSILVSVVLWLITHFRK